MRRYCEEEVWYDVYRIFRREQLGDRSRTVVYVGISRDYDKRQCQHGGKRGKYKKDGVKPECLVTVPYYGVARGIEQALMDMYGFTDNEKNFNLDKPRNTSGDPFDPDRNPPPFGLASHKEPTLDNKRNSIYPGSREGNTRANAVAKGMYCAFRVGGQEALNVLAFEPDKANNNDQVNKGWVDNFPRRDCSVWWQLKKGPQPQGGTQ